MKNIFCKRSDLKSEADVEALFLDRLLSKLRYPDNRVRRKAALDKIKVGRGSKQEAYRPDYVLLNRKGRPVVVADAKAPDEQPSAYLYQVSGYALGLNQRFEGAKPVRFSILSNGLLTLVFPWDSDTPILRLDFGDFEEDNAKFVELRSLLSYGALDIVEATEGVFSFTRPNLSVLPKTFIDCHNLIWKKEKMGPTDAFYEFAKIMFIKIREDHRIAGIVASGRKPKAADFNFSVGWIEEQVEKGVDENPMANILFRRIRDELEEKVRKGDKKRIFLKDESLKLRLSTVIDVVRMLEHFDLHGIDEDLNGRMFETFLNATVRGKELGQFFTPRSVVKYMTNAATLVATKDLLPYVLDGCCGSGGFLIEAMAVLVHQIDAMTNLSANERGRKKRELYEDHLFGIEASENITRIARLNMYLHGDGGSKIFTTDALDKDLSTDAGLQPERRSEVEELKACLVEGGRRFDAVLTNPPFSMSYKRKDNNEAKILDQYVIGQNGEGKPSSSVKSNVLFVERYCGLLAERGELLTVIDNTVLNGIESQRFRDFILEKFVVLQVIALPFNTFFRAQANVQTSILHLRKKEAGEEQGHVFMGILNNIGHDDHQRHTPERDNIPKLTQVFRAWKETGKIEAVFEENKSKEENLGCPFQIFVVPRVVLKKERLDAFYYSPDLQRTKEALRRREKAGQVRLITTADLNLIDSMNSKEQDQASGRMFRYFEIGDVTRDGAITTFREDVFEELPTRARLRVKAGDVIFAKNNSSRGTTVIVPPAFDGHLVTTGFIGVRPKDPNEALLLWSIFESETFRKQIYYLAITAVQPEIREEILREEFLLPVPTRKKDREALIEGARRVQTLHGETRSALDSVGKVAEGLFEAE